MREFFGIVGERGTATARSCAGTATGFVGRWYPSTTSMFKSGTLWRKTVDCSARALRCGAQQPISTEQEIIEDAGARFLVRVVSSLQRKSAQRVHASFTSKDQPTSGSPFLPYEKTLLVAELSATHVALLNKYNVVPNHLLLVTRTFEDQLSRLSVADFVALAQCLSEMDGLAFYNAGAAAGASQRHKHLQLVRLPLVSEDNPIPILPLLPTATETGRLHRVKRLPFRHAFASLGTIVSGSPAHVAHDLHEIYTLMVQELSLGSGEHTAPYNLLLTRDWMLLVPRSREHFESISINALGFAGALLVRTQPELELLKERGPMAALVAVGAPLESVP